MKWEDVFPSVILASLLAPADNGEVPSFFLPLRRVKKKAKFFKFFERRQRQERRSSVAELPCSLCTGTANFPPDKMAEEAPPDVPSEPADNAPLRERVESKTWKTRMEAFVELAKVRHPIRLNCKRVVAMGGHAYVLLLNPPNLS
jgi:hypothetical protein